MYPPQVQHAIDTGHIVEVSNVNKARQHIFDHLEDMLITRSDYHEWIDWWGHRPYYAPANVRWTHLLPGGCHISGIGYSVSTINPRNEAVVGVDLDAWWDEQLGKTPARRPLAEAMSRIRTVEERDALLRQYSIGERREYFQALRQASMKSMLAGLFNPEFDDQFEDVSLHPGSLDL